MKAFIILLSALISTSAWASLSIECGRSVDEDGVVTGTEFVFSSESEDIAAGDWELTTANGTPRNASVRINKKGDLEIFIKIGESLGGNVGTRYVVDSPRGESVTTGRKITEGGFAGGVTKELQCAVSEL